MLPDDQRLIASRYGLSDPKVMVSWIRSLNYLRNVCAHHSRLWNRNMTELEYILTRSYGSDLIERCVFNIREG